MRRSVGLLTFHRALNFGAVLQGLCLQQAIMRLGHGCTIVDYTRRISDGIYQWFRVPNRKDRILHDIRALRYVSEQVRLRTRFAAFRQRHLVLSAQRYESVAALRDALPGFDAYVTGSDQVWNPNMLRLGHGEVFFLKFVGAAKRIAYAPSFGVSEVPAEYRHRIASLLQKFDALSAREDTGCRIIRELTGRAAQHVLDPTLLLPAEFYDEFLVEAPFKSPYILLYAMLKPEELRPVAERCKTLLGLPIVAVVPVQHNPRRYSFADRVVYDAGPAEFLGWIRGAAFVCTSSFHGVALSVVFGKPFVTIPCGVANRRITSLLEQLGIAERQVANADALMGMKADLDAVDYSSAGTLLQKAVLRSKQYLQVSLE